MQEAISLRVWLITCIALEQLGRRAKGNERSSSDAREAMLWLDTVTSESTLENYVRLEGVDEIYGSWKEVEKLLLPKTLLSIDDVESEDEDEDEDDSDDSAEGLDESLQNLNVSARTSVSSTHSVDDKPQTPPSPGRSFPVNDAKMKVQNGNTKKPQLNGTSKSVVPEHLRPLFSHIMWLVQRETNPDSALASYILLTNDPEKQAIAQKFGIRAKRLEQLRDAVAREDREYRNHLILEKKESGELASSVAENGYKDRKENERPKSSNSYKSGNSNIQSNDDVDSDDEDEIVFRPVSRGSQPQKTNGKQVWDPNEFGRASAPTGAPTTAPATTPRGGRGGRGRAEFRSSPRGRGGPARGRGGFQPRGAYVPPGGPFRPTPTSPMSPTPRSNPDSNAVLNPDSYERPAPRVSGGRGGRRKLWEPN